VRTVKTSSEATATQIVWSWRKGSRSFEHLGSASQQLGKAGSGLREWNFGAGRCQLH
jgi:hypothetical protein